MFDPRIMHSVPDQGRKSVPLFPKRDARYEGRPEGDLIHANSLFKLRESDAKKASETKQESISKPGEGHYVPLKEQPQPALTFDSLVGKMMKIADMPVGTKFLSGRIFKYLKTSSTKAYSETNHRTIEYPNSEYKVIADPVVEVGDKVRHYSGLQGVVEKIEGNYSIVDGKYCEYCIIIEKAAR